MDDTLIDFDESSYLAAHPDVAEAVEAGHFASGLDHYNAHGRQEGRALRLDISRQEKILIALDKKGRGLEIGPSYNPVAPKRAGFNVQTLDHLDAGKLRAKYAGHGVDVGNIEDVDFVWSGEPLPELIGAQSCFDWIIASHVIEHVPDMVSFLIQCQTLLKPDGRLSLVVPDKRYCFDYFGTLTMTGQLLDAFAEKRTRPSPGIVFDYIANSTRLNGSITQPMGARIDEFELVHPLAQAQELWRQVSQQQAYVDCHCWRFIPDSFRLILCDLNMLGLIQLGVVKEYGTAGFEFFVTLAKGVAMEAPDRLAVLKQLNA
ncbi:MAG TPA: methyltransferase domain-containing protein [Candidimonas sp.]|nr:methyltransferase domain-containing protein [Candidimonas sp.]